MLLYSKVILVIEILVVGGMKWVWSVFFVFEVVLFVVVVENDVGELCKIMVKDEVDINY